MVKHIKIQVQELKSCVAVRGAMMPLGLAHPSDSRAILPIGSIVGVFASSELYLRFLRLLTFGFFTFYFLKPRRAKIFLGVYSE